MTAIRNFTLTLLLLACTASVGIAQDRADVRASSPPAITVTISTSAKGVRVATIGGVSQMRLEVLGASGEPLYSSGFQPGNVRDWGLEDAHGQPLPDGAYLCVVTVRELSGRLSVKQGLMFVQGGQASLRLDEAGQAGAAEPDKNLSPVTTDAAAVTLTANDGSDGQVVTTRGGLSFRAGDFFAGRDRELMRLTPEGDLGLGVAAPKAKLDVGGLIRARGGIQFDDGTMLTTARGSGRVSPWWSISMTATGDATAAAISGTGTANKLAKWLDNAGTLSDSVIAESNGNVGVGTASPALPLDVNGSARAGQLVLSRGFAPAGKGGYLFAGRGGPGTTDAEVGFFAANDGASGSSSEGPFFTLRGNNFTRTAGQRGNVYLAAGTDLASPAPGEGAITFITGGAERVVLDSAGNVGVGTTNPQAKLDVAGDLKVSGNATVNGNIAAKYQDVAEWVRSRRPLAAGTVVVLDSLEVNAVIPSQHPYDTHVAGVVSAQPGVLLGQGGEGKVMVATTGRVRVRVNATGRPVRVGDLLVTSGKAGVAMRSLPIRAGGTRIHRPGTIIGKALEPLAKGEGEILVLLSLQ